MARKKPRLLITVATTVSLASCPDSFRAPASTASTWSPSTVRPVASTARQRSASPSRAIPRSAPCSSTAERRASMWVEPALRLMLVPSGSAWIRMTLGTLGLEGGRTGLVGSAVRTVHHHGDAVEADRVLQAPHQVGDVGLGQGRVVADPPHVGTGGPGPALTESALDRILEGVVELGPATGEELDPVVGHRVVAGRQHDAEVGAGGVGQERHARRGEHPEPHHVHTSTGQTRDDRPPRGTPPRPAGRDRRPRTVGDR